MIVFVEKRFCYSSRTKTLEIGFTCGTGTIRSDRGERGGEHTGLHKIVYIWRSKPFRDIWYDKNGTEIDVKAAVSSNLEQIRLREFKVPELFLAGHLSSLTKALSSYFNFEFEVDLLWFYCIKTQFKPLFDTRLTLLDSRETKNTSRSQIFKPDHGSVRDSVTKVT